MMTPCTTSCISTGRSGGTGVGIAVDAAGNAYIAGNDPSATNLPTTPRVSRPTGIGAFVAKVNAGGTGLGYLTYIGSGEVGNGPLRSAPLTTPSMRSRWTGPGMRIWRGRPTIRISRNARFLSAGAPNFRTCHGFLAKLNPTGSAMVWATYFDADGSAMSIALDANGNVSVTGTTNSSTFPTPTDGPTGPEYLAELNATGTKVDVLRLGIPGGTVAQSVAVDRSGLVHVAGFGRIHFRHRANHCAPQ